MHYHHWRFNNPPFFPGKIQTVFSIYVLFCWVYYTVCVFVSHNVYRNYKSLVVEIQQTGYGMMQMPMNGYEMQSMQGGRAGQNQPAAAPPRSYFQGQGVSIG